MFEKLSQFYWVCNALVYNLHTVGNTLFQNTDLSI